MGRRAPHFVPLAITLVASTILWASAIAPFSQTTIIQILMIAAVMLRETPEFAQDRQEFSAPPSSKQGAISPAPEAPKKSDYISHLPSPCFIVNKDHKIILANTPAQNLFRLPPNVPISIAYLRNPDLESLLEDPNKGETTEKFYFDTPNSGSRSWRASLVECDDGCTLVHLEDYTEIVSAQKARSEFLANASHELRTPLTAISGFTETLRSNPTATAEQQQSFLAIMQKQAARMQGLIEDLLSLSQIESYEYQRPNSKTNLIDAVKDALSPHASSNSGSDTVDFLTLVDKAFVLGDRNELTQIIENLLSNAHKYAPRSAVKLTLGLSASEEEARLNAMQVWPNAARSSLQQGQARNQHFYWVRVEDSGDGISAAHLPRLGERFYRTDPSRSNRTAGTGLGLAIVKHIINRHRGGFGVESEIGRGSAFGFWLPSAGSADQPNLPR